MVARRPWLILAVPALVALTILAVTPSGRWVSEGGVVRPAAVAGEPVGAPSSGAFLLTAVHERSVSRAEVVWGWLRGWDLHRDGATVGPVRASRGVDVQGVAWAAALRVVGVRPLDVTEVGEGTVAERAGLRPGDRIVAVDERAPSGAAIDGLLSGGWAAPLHVVRDGVLTEIDLVPGPPWPQPSGGGAVLMGAPPDDPGAPPDVDTGTLQGASAGLGLALAYVDALTAGDLTGGLQVASSGAVVETGGTIGGMGGLPHKLEAAAAAGADVFLVDADDAATARAAAPDTLPVVGVEGVGGAVAWLCRHGGVTSSCAVVLGTRDVDPSAP